MLKVIISFAIKLSPENKSCSWSILMLSGKPEHFIFFCYYFDLWKFGRCHQVNYTENVNILKILNHGTNMMMWQVNSPCKPFIPYGNRFASWLLHFESGSLHIAWESNGGWPEPLGNTILWKAGKKLLAAGFGSA